MAESTLSLTYSDITREVGNFAGWPSFASWTAKQTADFGFILKRGLRRFYFPNTPEVPKYEWSFLLTTATFALINADYDYDLPDGFSGVILDDSLTFAIASGNPRLKKITESEFRALQSMANATGIPVYYAVRAKAFAPTAGHRWEALFYPTPNGSMTCTYRYVALPNVIDATNLYPVGGAAHGETILAAILAEAEKALDDDPEGPNEKKFQALLNSSIRLDQEQKGV